MHACVLSAEALAHLRYPSSSQCLRVPLLSPVLPIQQCAEQHAVACLEDHEGHLQAQMKVAVVVVFLGVGGVS